MKNALTIRVGKVEEKKTNGIKVKVKVTLYRPRRPRGGVEVYLHSFLSLGARWG
jgi:hypothetical protein